MAGAKNCLGVAGNSIASQVGGGGVVGAVQAAVVGALVKRGKSKV